MARAFGVEEKEHVRSRLLDRGEELFSRFGLRKTAVGDITAAAGISKGSFYAFFESKEALFYAVLRRLEESERERIRACLTAPGTAPEEGLRRALDRGLELFRRHPFLRVLLDPQELEQLHRGLPRSRLDEHLKADALFVQELAGLWGGRSSLLAVDPAVAAGLLRAVFFLGLHERDIGAEVFPRVQEELIRAVSRIILKQAEGSP